MSDALSELESAASDSRVVELAVPIDELAHDHMAARVARVDREKFPGSDSLAQEASLTVIRTFGALNDLMNGYLAPFTLSRARLHVLSFLNHEPDGRMRMTDIGASLQVTKAYVTKMIDGLVRDGLAERVVDPLDRRTVYTQITPAGRKRLQDVMPVHLNHLHDLWAGLSQEEKQLLIHLLAKARQQMLEATGQPASMADRAFPL